jgi:hypothetical protein
METKKLCIATKLDGSKCEAAALPDSEFCVFHDPSRAAERRVAQSRGGQGNRMKTLAAGTPDVKVENSRDLLALMNMTISQVRTGIIDPRIANTIGYLADITMRLSKQNELEERIKKLENLLIHRPELLSGV